MTALEMARPWMGLGVVDAPTGLGLRPPRPGAEPGTGRAPQALRAAGLHAGLAARGATEYDAVVPAPYRDDAVAGVPRVRNQEAIVSHARALARRLGTVLDERRRPMVIGGDCSLLIGAGLALRARGRYGLVHIDGHTDFRHPGNSRECASLAGEDLAAAIGLHWPAVSDIDGWAPYFRRGDVVHVGCRTGDSHVDEAAATIADVVPASEVSTRTADRALRVVAAPGLDGFWVHLDVDVLDPTDMPAVDSPAPGGLDVATLTALLRPLAAAAVGIQVCVFDPDLDPTGSYARTLSELVLAALP